MVENLIDIKTGEKPKEEPQEPKASDAILYGIQIVREKSGVLRWGAVELSKDCERQASPSEVIGALHEVLFSMSLDANRRYMASAVANEVISAIVASQVALKK